MTPIRVATSFSALLGRLAGGAMAWRSPTATPPVEAKASSAGPLIAFESLRQPAWTPRDYAAFAREGFMGNAIVYRVGLDWMEIDVREENRPDSSRLDVGDDVTVSWDDRAVAVVSG